MVKKLNLVQSEKAPSKILVTLLGNATFIRFLHPRKTYAPRVLIVFGMFILSNEIQPSKAKLPIVVTEAGIIITLSDAQPLNAFSPIVVTGKFITL